MNKVYFFNVANFEFAEIDLRKKNIFFVGDNGSGKTTAIRAIHYFYNSDTRALGIDSNKLSFKDFYFQYTNSYIVYEFDEFFVFMYKRQGDIKKIFSKKKFDINKIIKDGVIVDIDEALRYVKEASLKTPVNISNEEYKSIIYGMNKKYRDFKITTIRDYNTFVNLYNKIFNVNKSVFDTNSIKEIIFTTIENVEAGEIEYDNFKEEIARYRYYFKFYKAFKSQEESIEKLYSLKNEIINLNESLSEIVKKINYRKKYEENYLNELNTQIFDIENRINYLYKLSGVFKRKEEKTLKKLSNKINEIEFNLNKIKELKEKFSLEKIQKAKRDVLLIDEKEDELNEVITNLESLKREIKSIEESIEDEIKSLKRKIKALKEEENLKLLTLKREIEEKIELKKETLKNEYIQKEEELILEIEKSEEDIEKEIKAKQKYIDEKNEVESKYKKLEKELKQEINSEIEEIFNEIKFLKQTKSKNSDEIFELKRLLSKKEKDLEFKIAEKKEEFQKSKDELANDIKTLEVIIETKEGSFKEFLNEFVEDWEKELYPVIDKKLLSMSVDTLKPKLISTPVFGISLDKTNLDQIPTRKEAEERIAELKEKIELLKKEEIKVIENLKLEFNQEKNKLLAEIEFLEEENRKIDEKIVNLNNVIKEKKEKLNREIEKLKSQKKEEIKLIDINILNIDEKIKKLNEKVKSTKHQIKLLKKELNEKLKEIEKEKEKLFNLEKEKIKKEFKEKENDLNKTIEKLQEEKRKISKDERIEKLNLQKESLEREIKYLYSQKRFLEEYEENRDFIEKEPILVEEIKLCKKRRNVFENFVKRLQNSLEEKIAKLNDEKKKINELVDKVNSGLKEAKKIKFEEFEDVESSEFLIDLVLRYLDEKDRFDKSISEIKRLADRLNYALRKYLIEGFSVNFNIENIDMLDKDEFEKIDELYKFKTKKFEITNNSMIKNIKNLLSGILDKKISSFEKAKERFTSQLRKINKNLEDVDFGIVKNIQIKLQKEDDNILVIFEKIRKEIEDIMIMLSEESLFFEKNEAEKKLIKMENMLLSIKDKIQKSGFSITDVVDIELEFIENSKKRRAKVIKNESSTGGSILLKIAIAVSLLELFIVENAGIFLILDEVGVISTKNQKLLKNYVNSRGLGVIYVTPDLPIIDTEDINIYKFRNNNGVFESIRLIGEEGLKIEE